MTPDTTTDSLNANSFPKAESRAETDTPNGGLTDLSEVNAAMSDAELLAQARSAFAKTPVPLDPIDEVSIEGKDAYRLTIPVPRDYFYFLGHFDGLPILPGVVQLDMVVRRQIARLWPDLNRSPKRIAQLKFVRTIPPGTVLTVTLEHVVAQNWVLFTLADGAKPCCTGRFVF